MGRQKTEYIGSIRGMYDEEDAPPADRRSMMGRQ